MQDRHIIEGGAQETQKGKESRQAWPGEYQKGRKNQTGERNRGQRFKGNPKTAQKVGSRSV